MTFLLFVRVVITMVAQVSDASGTLQIQMQVLAIRRWRIAIGLELKAQLRKSNSERVTHGLH